jgi:predicted dienelactone hydrolase
MNRLLLLLCCTGCGLASPATGVAVTAGVGRAHFELRTNGTDLVPVTVYFPATADGAARGSNHPAVVFVQGGLVGTSRYEWQALELARQGYVVALAENELQLAFFSIDYGQAARTLLVDPPQGSLLEGLVDRRRIAVAGHSLGSVVALKLGLEGNFRAVVLEAGFPDGADLARLPEFTRPTLSLAGSLDCLAKLDDVKTGWAQLSSPTALVILEGVTHYQFTDSDREDRQRNCSPRVELADAHQRIAGALTAFLNAALRDERVGAADLRAIPQSTVEVR